MKRNLILLLALSVLPCMAFAQSTDDDLYFVPGKKKAKTERVEKTDRAATRRDQPVVYEGNPKVDYHTGQLRDVDEYNRRGSCRRRCKDEAGGRHSVCMHRGQCW